MAGSSSIELSQEKSVTPAGQEKKHEMQLEKKNKQTWDHIIMDIVI